jgi:hypothetical protein
VSFTCFETQQGHPAFVPFRLKIRENPRLRLYLAFGFEDIFGERKDSLTITKEEMKNCVWLKPELVTQIEFTEWTPDGHLRHSKFVGLREDKEVRKGCAGGLRPLVL